MTLLISRRRALAFGVLPLASLAWEDDAFAQARGPISAVRVDVRSLRAAGANDVADWVAQILPGELRRALSRRWAASGGGTVVAQINAVRLRTARFRNTSRASRVERTDIMDGDLRLLNAAGRTIAEAHLSTSRDSPGGNALDSAHLRRLGVTGLCERFAHFTPGRLGL